MILRQKRPIKGLIGLLAAAASTLCLAQAQAGVPTDRTTSECEVFHAITAVEIPDSEFTKSWTGACVGGKAEGWGLYTLRLRSLKSGYSSEQTLHGIAHEGQLVGYTRGTFSSSMSDMRSTSWLYTADGQTVSGDGRLGLSITDLAMGSPTVTLPTSVASLPRVRLGVLGRISTSSRYVWLLGSVCSSHAERFPECKDVSFKDAALVFAIEEAPIDSLGGINHSSKKLTFCPNPRTLVGCEATVEKVIAPYRQEVLDFIRRTKPDVDALLAASRAKLAVLPQPPALSNAPAR